MTARAPTVYIFKSQLGTNSLASPSGATPSKPRVRERCKRDGALGQAYSCVKSPTGATLRTGRSEYAAEQLRFNYAFEGCPCRALFLVIPATQGLVALAGLRTLGFGGVAPLGLILAACVGCS